MPSSKKYKLFSTSSSDGSRAPCAFFASPAGCRNGDSCKFAHVKSDKNELSAAAAAVKSPRFSTEAGSVVSSESEPEAQSGNSGAQVGKSINVVERQVEKDGDNNPFLQPGESPQKEPQKKKNRRGKRSDDHLPFVNPKKKAKATILPEPSAPTSVPAEAKTPAATAATPKQPKTKTSKKKPSAPPSFLSLNLPICPFTVQTETSSKGNKAPKRQDSAVSAGESASEKEGDKLAVVASLPLPKSTATGRKWLDAVKATQESTRFSGIYDFEKYKKVDEDLGICGPSGWIKAKPYGDWSKDLPQTIAIDCEMCQTTDPVSGKNNAKALCRISIVDGETKETLLDTLVKPAWPVTDYRSWVNGIEAEHLKNVQFTVRHAQAFMMALCSEETVIMGHAVHNDLVAIGMEHHCVVDSALLFKSKQSEHATVSLRDLALGVLKKEMPNVHDSVNDAKTALLCLEHYLEKNGDVEPVERTEKNYPKKFQSFRKLFIHRIPKSVDESHLSKMFLAHTDVAPSEVAKVEFAEGAQYGKSHVTFQTQAHADLAFETIKDKAQPDSSGRLAKKVYLRNGSYVRVRKMAVESKQKDGDKKSASQKVADGTVARRFST